MVQEKERGKKGEEREKVKKKNYNARKMKYLNQIYKPNNV